jgi:hypothetical protein
MKLKFSVLCSTTLLACALSSSPVFAGPVTTWNFWKLAASPAQPGFSYGSTQAIFSNGGHSMTAQSVTESSPPSGLSWKPGTAYLYAKNGGSATERGLGLTGDPAGDNEIYYPNGIELSGFSGHISSVMIGSIQGSATNGETWAVWGSNNGTSWTELGQGMGGLTENFQAASLSSYSDIIVSDPSRTPYTNSNDIVLMSVTTVPEPGTLALFGAGLLGCGLFITRRRRAKQG